MKYTFVLTFLLCVATIMGETQYKRGKRAFPLKDGSCKCVKYTCGCCQYIEWDLVSINGTLCTNTTYLDHDYGFSITLTFNDYVIFNESVSARNPPPICFGDDIVEALKAEICLRMYDIDLTSTHFYSCFDMEAKLLKLRVVEVNLGCMNIPIQKEVNATINSIDKQQDPTVILV